MKLCARITSALLAILLLMGFAPSALAYSNVDVNALCSLTLTHRSDEIGLSDVEFRIYRVASVSEQLRFTFTDEFARSDIALNHEAFTQANWQAFASSVFTYALANGITPTATKATDQYGNVDFQSLEAGLYLVVADAIIIDETMYTIDPFVVSLPTLDAITQKWTYDAIITTKVALGPALGLNVDIPLQKIWNDKNGNASRPRRLTIELYQNGVLYDQIELNEQNYWRHTWNNLAATDAQGKPIIWTTIEKNVPDDYTVQYTQDAGVYYITNTLDANSGQPGPGPGTNPDPLIPGGIPNDGGTPGDEEIPLGLPQTGQLWWPVPVMAIMGLGCFGIGWIVANEKRK
ncbi:Cna B-type domain-containing protein [Eubacteriales bacterium OttesenSCG-928-K08]|nr:Cna B-type domain-containing protein [Eubacteriales bacterium OttesenSCG-928-K08]